MSVHHLRTQSHINSSLVYQPGHKMSKTIGKHAANKLTRMYDYLMRVYK